MVGLLTALSLLVGCGNNSTKGSVLLKEGEVKEISVSSLPEGYNYSFTGESVGAIIDYLAGLNLSSDFSENPDEYGGMTWVIVLEYDDNSEVELYHFGNMFIMVEGGSWYKMNYDEANQFSTLIEGLSE
ncbi:MAG: hypothetical protein IJ419_06460 [Agathobacter sp.]|nr:hypothetical protein [Agathobacter sp.]